MKVECYICEKMVDEADVCSTDACRDCHVSITFEDCVNRTTPDDLKWRTNDEKRRFAKQ